MSLARAFTTRRARHSIERNELKSQAEPTSPQRSKTLKLRSSGSIRNKISSPVELTHTTNMLSYNAPNISPQTAKAMALTSPKSLTRISDDESDKISTATSTPPTSPETSYPQDRRASSPEPNHLSCYFTAPKPAGKATSKASTPAEPTAAFPAAAAPTIPQRAPSHTKKPFEGFTRHRSISRLSEQSSRTVSTNDSLTFSRSSSTSTNTSAASVSRASSVSHHAKPSFQHPPMATAPVKTTIPAAPALPVAPAARAHATHTAHTAHATPSPVSSHAGSLPPVSHKMEYSESHPFGHELAQVSELVEEFGKEEALSKPHTRAARTHINPIVEEEERELIRRGCKKFSAEDYIAEIQGLVSNYLGEVRPSAAMWI